MSERMVIVEINQQQAQMLDRLIAEGKHGDSYGEVLRNGFLHFCRGHREVGAASSSTGEVQRGG